MAKSDIATVDLENYPNENLICRNWGHRWADPMGLHWTEVVGPRGRLLELRTTVPCERCSKTRDRSIDPKDGHERRGGYNDPPDYRLPGQVDRSKLRLEQLRRIRTRGQVEKVKVDAATAKELTDARR